MKTTTNVYILVDNSVYAKRRQLQLRKNIVKLTRATQLLPNVKLHLICYNDKAYIGDITNLKPPCGNPNFATALSLLQNVINYQNKYGNAKTRSIVLWYCSGNVLQGYEPKLNRLFQNKVFNKSLRYVVKLGNPDPYCKQAFATFTDSPQNVLDYFSPNRLCSLVKNVSNQFCARKYMVPFYFVQFYMVEKLLCMCYNS